MERSGRTWQQVMERQNSGPVPTPPQPHRDWPWALNVGGVQQSAPSWQDIESGLRGLNQETDSFLVLEQRDTQNPERSWFIQCAVALEGPDAGMYAVEIGCSAPGGPLLWERMTPDVQDVVAYFSDAYDHRDLDVSGFRETEL